MPTTATGVIRSVVVIVVVLISAGALAGCRSETPHSTSRAPVTKLSATSASAEGTASISPAKASKAEVESAAQARKLADQAYTSLIKCREVAPTC